MLQTDGVLHASPQPGDVAHRSRLPRWIVAAAFAAALLTLLAIAALAVRGMTGLAEHARSVDRAHRLIAQVSLVSGLIKDIEAGLSVYVMAGHSEPLESYRVGHSTLGPELARLREMAADDPAQSQRVARLEALVHERFERSQRIVALAQAGDLQAGRPAVGRPAVDATGKLAMDRIREESGAIVAAARDVLAQRSYQMEHSARQMGLVIGGGSAASLALLVLAYLAVRRQIARHSLAERKFRGLLEAAPDAIVIVRSSGEILLVNAGLEALFGYARAELLGKPVEILLPERFRGGHAGLRRRFFEAPSARLMGVRDRALFARRRDGSEFPVEVSLSPLKTEDGMLVTAAVRDVSDWRRTEAEIGALNEHLELRAGQLAATNRELETFSYSVSHDLRTPLRAIDGFTRMLAEDHGDRLDEEGRRLLSVVLDNTRRMASLIDDLLAFSRLGRQPLRIAEVDMTALAREALDELHAAQAYASVRVDLQPLPQARGDRALLRQVWVNLLSNAFKYTARRPDPRVEISGRVRGEEYLYCVRDNGVGFDMQYADKLFGVFQRLHSVEEFPGTGVGLATVHRVVVRHGGVVWAEGKPGEGAAFHFALPAGGDDE